MADWATISSLATAGGTLVLAVATFQAVRSSNRSARIAETALSEERRAVLVHSRISDPAQKIAFADGRWVQVEGGGAVVDDRDGVIYLALSVRNVGAGIGVIQAWRVWPDAPSNLPRERPDLADFREQTRDLYVPGGDTGLWQAALRRPEDPLRGQIGPRAAAGETIAVDLLYSDQLGGQRTITRFALLPGERGTWLSGATRHWFLDGDTYLSH